MKLHLISAAFGAALLAAPAIAQNAMNHGLHGQSGAMAAHMEAMDKMMSSMNGMTETGDPDADFLLMMIPHHQSAIDMATTELEQGDDPETRTLAQRIIDAQKQEIADMKAMLARLGVKAPE